MGSTWTRTVAAILMVATVCGPLAGVQLANAAAVPRATAAPATAEGGTWGPAIELPGIAALDRGRTSSLTDVSCPSPGDCSAVGNYDLSLLSGWGTAFVAGATSGTWASASHVPGLASLAPSGGEFLSTLSCATPGNCLAGGRYEDGAGISQAFVVQETDGTWGPAIQVPGVAALEASGSGSSVKSVSCATSGNCVAGGYYMVGGLSEPFVADEVAGVWASALEVPGTGVLDVGVSGLQGVIAMSCRAPGDCSAGGNYATKDGAFRAFVVSEVSGVWETAIQVPGLAQLMAGGARASLVALSCGSPGNCTAGGDYIAAPKSGQYPAFVVSEIGGVWERATEVRGIATLYRTSFVKAAEVTSVSCPAATSCTVAGAVTTGKYGLQDGFLAQETNGRWSDAAVIPDSSFGVVVSVSCGAPNNCSAGGVLIIGDGGSTGVVVNQVRGSLGPPVAVRGVLSGPDERNGEALTVSCAAPGSCTAGGSYQPNRESEQAFIDVESPSPAPALRAITPDRGPMGGGTRVLLRGSVLLGTLGVQFGTTFATQFQVVNAGAVWVTAPPGSGTQTVRLLTQSGATARSAALTFTYQRPH
jgi:IPT/TIG domain